MRANNNFNLTGRLARDPEFFPGSMPRVRIRMAVDGYDRQAKTKKADFFTVTLFGRTAEAINQYCTKGSYLSVTGEMRENQYTDKQGNDRYETQLVGSDAVFGPKTSGGGSNVPSQNDPNDPYGFGQ
jgi:single-strand DNA-binding protein